MLFLPQSVVKLFLRQTDDPRSSNRLPLNSLAARHSTATYRRNISTPKIIYPETKNRPICEVFRGQHGAGGTEQADNSRGGVAQQ